jgi:hypothetical protein
VTYTASPGAAILVSWRVLQADKAARAGVVIDREMATSLGISTSKCVRKCDQCVLDFYDTSKKGTRR